MFERMRHEQELDRAVRRLMSIKIKEEPMPDTDFTPALVEVAHKNIQTAADKKDLAEWMREPDHVQDASLGWLVDWMNRRPVAAASRLCS